MQTKNRMRWISSQKKGKTTNQSGMRRFEWSKGRGEWGKWKKPRSVEACQPNQDAGAAHEEGERGATQREEPGQATQKGQEERESIESQAERENERSVDRKQKEERKPDSNCVEEVGSNGRLTRVLRTFSKTRLEEG